ncbi:mannos-6-phosphate isomerase [Pleurotus eryngii]|uniref:Mannose-6-phosphate isomerase n=1 Tax=Pleurotus eryngii TaxID=5323 RepID=A0A9P6A249_PLEER|nr:mannos-6-phosphate isomerase [Pleurotus eryngii]
MAPVFKIIPTTQKYDWGKIGRDSKVAQLAPSDVSINEDAPYAELWMGTHVKSPSTVQATSQSLSEALAAHPELIGESVTEKFRGAYGTDKGNLPFLFKVLSIHKALSIQTHPDEPTAKELHRTQGDIYKDPNHKPEMALALTPFLALCGFMPLSSIASNITSTPEVAALIPPSTLSAFQAIASSSTPSGPTEKQALKDVFSAVMTASDSVVQDQLRKLIARYKAQDLNAGEKAEIVGLVLRLNTQFPGDIGIFCAFLLNQIKLQPGEAIFLGAGEPHAYVEGDIMECMANSDNVIRAGLTPKLRDIPNLVAGLTYTAAPPEKHFVRPKPFGSSATSSTLYDPPIPEFSVVQLALGGGKSESHRAVGGPSIAIATKGSGSVKWGGGSEDVAVGDVFFIGTGTEVMFDASDDLVMYRAFTE